MTQTTIEWTDCTWNPVRGCSMAKGSEAGGCLNCYAARMAARNMPGHRSPTTGEPFAVVRGSGPRWTGKVELIPGKLAEPLHWRKPRRCFVNSMSDLFHEGLPFEQIAAVLGVVAATPHITYQVLTKRPEVAAEFYEWIELVPMPADLKLQREAYQQVTDKSAFPLHRTKGTLLSRPWPLPNLWLGTSVENQETADVRIPRLLEIPAAVRFLSYEPALGPVDLDSHTWLYEGPHWQQGKPGGLDWVIAGGESGPGARPPHPAWFRSARDQCVAAGVPFLFKQWGEWGPPDLWEAVTHPRERPESLMLRVGKRKAGRLLDGRTWDEFPPGAVDSTRAAPR